MELNGISWEFLVVNGNRHVKHGLRPVKLIELLGPAQSI
jgi:hypothetical protein